LDFSNDALMAAEKGLERLTNAYNSISRIKPADKSSVDINTFIENAFDAISDDFNTPIALSNIFEIVRIINSAVDNKEFLNLTDIEKVTKFLNDFLFDIFGLKFEQKSANNQITNELIEMLLQLRLKAKQNKDFATSDFIRDELKKLGVEVKDTKDGFVWDFKKII